MVYLNSLRSFIFPLYVHSCNKAFILCFLKFQAGVQQKWEAAGMFSCEGEYVEFAHSVLVEGPVEVNDTNLAIEC